MRHKTILITGGAGFIGRHLAARLLAKQAQNKIIVFDNLSKGKKFLPHSQSSIIFHKGDITDEREINKCVAAEKPNIIIHLAAMHIIPECERNPKKTFQTNIIGTLNLVVAANRHSVKHFIFASSAAVYGKSKRPLAENAAVSPEGAYGISKLAGEKIVSGYFRNHWSIIRLFNIIGKHDPNNHLIPAIKKQINFSKTLRLGNTESVRDYLFIEDLIDGICLLIKNKQAREQILNFGTGRGQSVKNVVSHIEKILGKKFKIVTDKKLERENDNPVLIASIRNSKRLLGWSPKHSIYEALTKIFSIV